VDAEMKKSDNIINFKYSFDFIFVFQIPPES
jgi:hypothetical protein